MSKIVSQEAENLNFEKRSRVLQLKSKLFLLYLSFLFLDVIVKF